MLQNQWLKGTGTTINQIWNSGKNHGVLPSLKQGTKSYPPVILQDFKIIIIYRKEMINIYQSPNSL